MNRLSGAEAMVRMLALHRVETIFGLCGDTSLPLYDALFRTGTDIRHILTRDERHAAYMADGYARVTGRVGVCEGPSGGGATYILPGLVEANESSIPILAITTDISTTGRGRYTLTELDQEALFRPLTKWNGVVDRAGNLPRMVRAAFAAMTAGRPGAAHLGLPLDVQREPLDESEIWAETSGDRYPAERATPDAPEIDRAAELLTAAKHPIIVCGGGVVISGAQDVLVRLAEHLAAPVATTISGQGSIADDHPLAVGVVGSNGGTPETRALVDAADLVMFVGCRAGSVTTERWQHPAPGAAKIVHLDVDAGVFGANYPTDAAVHGDAARALDAIAARLASHNGRTARSEVEGQIASAKARKAAAFLALAQSTERPIRPERVVAALQEVLPPDAILVADPGTPCPYFSAYFDWRTTGRHFISNRAHGALGYALAASMGAQVGRPDAKVVAAMGDGSFAMCVGELETIVRYKLPITLIVFSNQVFGWIKAGQKASFGERYYSVDFGATDHAAVAAAFGIKSWRVEDPEALAGVLREAVETDGPTLVDVIAQPLQEARAPVSEWIA